MAVMLLIASLTAVLLGVGIGLTIKKISEVVSAKEAISTIKQGSVITIDMTNIDKIDETIKESNRKELVKNTIVSIADQYGVDYSVALSIADCESDFDMYANNPNSTAKGVFQFTDPTWKFIKAQGHQYDFRENIKQFFIWYPLHPEWWECKK